jgi:hypothetical protein
MWEYNQAQVLLIQWVHHVAIQESDKSSRLTGGTLHVSKKLLYTFCDVRHPHEMVFVEPSHVFLDEMIGEQDDCLAFELRSLPRVSEVTISVGTLFTLTSELGAKLFGHILWENVRWVDGWVTEEQHTQILLLFGGSVNLYSTTGLLSFVLGVVGLRLPPLRCSSVKVVLEVGRDAPSAREFLSSFPIESLLE